LKRIEGMASLGAPNVQLTANIATLERTGGIQPFIE
jgi:hypothetical protein